MATLNPREIAVERPSTFDEKGNRLKVHPFQVSGLFRKYRDFVYWVLILFFLILPWTKVGGQQTVLLDIVHRKFVLIGITFWAHDLPLIFFLFAFATIGIALVTAVLGRAWCGWACPQTVFIDRIYRWIETKVEGSHLQRQKLDQSSWDFTKTHKKATKWLLFFLVSSTIAHSFSAYFIGAERLWAMSLSSPSQNWTEFLVVSAMTLLLLFDFGWFREQFCIIMCPYGRFQAVLLDQDSLTVSYDEKRGEPRREPGVDEHGDCVNCFRCVAACPTGIDIRNGLQMECIACTACIDACDEVMDKVGYPRGLIRYASESSLTGKTFKILRPRTIIYVFALFSIIGILATILSNRSSVDVKFVRAIEAPYTKEHSTDGTSIIVNHYRLRIKNQSTNEQTIKLRLDGNQKQWLTAIAPLLPMTLAPGTAKEAHVFFTFKESNTPDTKQAIALEVTDEAAHVEIVKETIAIVAPVLNN